MRRCPACHALYPDDDRFCEVDGEVLVVERAQLSGTPTLPLAPPPSDVHFTTGDEGQMVLSIAARLSPEDVVDLVRQTLDVCHCFDRDGLAWQPQPEDFMWLPEKHMALAQARGVFRRSGAFDARPSLRALGEALLDAPVAACETGIVRLLSDPTLPSMSRDEAMQFVRDTPTLQPERVDGAALLMHIGYKRPVQQDAFAATAGDGWLVIALCDGVSGSIDGGLAARVGSAHACKYVAELVGSGRPADQLVSEGIMAGHREVCVAAREAFPEKPADKEERRSSRPPGGPIASDRAPAPTPETPNPATTSTEPPGATIVLMLVKGRTLTVGWAGDSRAYLVAEVPKLLTRDHSWANAMLATGHVTEEEAHAAPLAYALTRCIGPLDDAELEPEVRTFALPPKALVVACSDGLWSYLARADVMAATVRRAGSEPARVARWLVHEALMRGGHDNVSVAVYSASDE